MTGSTSCKRFSVSQLVIKCTVVTWRVLPSVSFDWLSLLCVLLAIIDVLNHGGDRRVRWLTQVDRDGRKEHKPSVQLLQFTLALNFGQLRQSLLNKNRFLSSVSVRRYRSPLPQLLAEDALGHRAILI